MAAQVGRPAAVRAVGTTNGLNALAIIVPCHRVVGADGKLVGYGGGLWRNYTQWPFGVSTFFCYPSSFAPHVAQRYWQAFQAGDAKTAGTIITQIEDPFAGLE